MGQRNYQEKYAGLGPLAWIVVLALAGLLALWEVRSGGEDWLVRLVLIVALIVVGSIAVMTIFGPALGRVLNINL